MTMGRIFPLMVTVESPLSISASGAGRAASVIRNSILRPVIGGWINMPPWGVTLVTIVVLPLALSAILLFVMGATPRPWKTFWGPYLTIFLLAPMQQKLLTFPMTHFPTCLLSRIVVCLISCLGWRFYRRKNCCRRKSRF